MAITNKHLLLRATKILPELLIEQQLANLKKDFVKQINGIDFVIPDTPCKPGCSLFPEVRIGPDGRFTVYVCKRPDLSPCP